MSDYNRINATNYAFKYAITPNKNYPHYPGRDCTNFISQCVHAGGARHDFNPHYPWWSTEDETSICWSIAHSFYWYILTRTHSNAFGIKAITKSIFGDKNYSSSQFAYLEIGDLIQYSWKGDKINHSAIITDFSYKNNKRIPLITQHQPYSKNVPFYRNAQRTIFHHITDIN